MKKYNIGLFGFGCVGQGFAQLLAQNSYLSTKITKICVKHQDKPRENVPGELVFDADSILNDDTINIIVELIDDANFAFKIVCQALKNGKNVVSANKKMIAENYNALENLQLKYGGKLYFEGAVCASIPVINTLRNYYSYDQVNSLCGILNGSTNYILTKVIDESINYKSALEDARKNGFAESDPTLDVNGSDAAFKLALLIGQAFNVSVNPNDITKVGIEQISENDVQFAKENNLKIKLIAYASRLGNEIIAWVAPQFIETSDFFAKVDREYNAVKINCKAIGDQLLIGKGAGKLPTGLAVFSDIGAIVQPANSLIKKEGAILTKTFELEVYVGYSSALTIDLSLFKVISEKNIGWSYTYVIGNISIENLNIFVKKHPKVSVIIGSNRNESPSNFSLNRRMHMANIV